MTINDPTAFSSVINPLAVTASTVNLDNTTDGLLTYGSIITVAGAQFNEYIGGTAATWAGTTGQNWSLGTLPQASEYVLLPPPDVPGSAMIIDSAVTVAGLQANMALLFQAGGQLR